MKMCDECGCNPANIHLTQIMQNETQSFHLCDECAQKRGIHISIDEAAINPAQTGESTDADTECPSCGMKLSEFRTTGWLGCAACYEAFNTEIEGLLVNFHGSAEHKGKQYGQVTIDGHKRVDLSQLRHELDTAIANEEFERAAMLRDTIQNLNDAKAR